MNEHDVRIRYCPLIASLALLFVLPLVNAQIYKWVDESGRTHYAERKDAPANAKTREVKVQSQVSTTPASKTSARNWEEEDLRFRQRQIEKEMAERQKIPPVVQRPRSRSGGREDGSEESRCNLARDILDGSVRLRNGKPTGQHEREIAQEDVKRYCR